MDKNKWVNGDADLIMDTSRVFMMTGMTNVGGGLKRKALWVCLPERIPMGKIIELVEELKDTCERVLDIKDVEIH